MRFLPSRKDSSAKVDVKELGLVSGFILGRHFFGVEDLHYGLWDGLPADVHHLALAQQRYSDFLLKQIPPGVKTILDVGCGTGSVAKQLLDAGYQVDCVSPSPFLTKYAKERVGDRARFFLTRFEDVQVDRKYDLVLFCESFQYIPPSVSLAKSLTMLNPGGHVLICDFFRTNEPGKSPIGGGHRWTSFQEELEKVPLECERDIDLTRQTAPTLTLINGAMHLAISPIWEMTKETLSAHYPRTMRFLQWLLRKKLARIEQKQLAGKRDPEAFARFKSYRLLVYRKRDAFSRPMLKVA